MQINLTRILLQEGKTQDFKGSLELKSFDSRLGHFKIVEKTPIALSVTNTGNQVLLVKGNCSVSIEIPCSRCLTSVAVTFELQPEREIDMKKSREEREEALEEDNYMEDKILNADKLMHNEILINWPLQILCSDDCKGICSKCGADKNVTLCDCDTGSLDPRMAAINDIFSKFKEV